MLPVRPRGEGVRGNRPPAVLVEKIPVWVLTGVDTVGVAMFLYVTMLCE